MRYRDEWWLRADQLRAELANVERVVSVLAGDGSPVDVGGRRDRYARFRAIEPFDAWWYRNVDRRPAWLRPLPARRGAAPAEAPDSIATELARIANTRITTLRARVAAAEASTEDPAVTDTVDALQLARELRRAIDAADTAASLTQCDAIRAAIEGRAAAASAKGSSFADALRQLARARVHLELMIASLLPVRGEDDPIVLTLAAIARDLGAPADVPDRAWRREVATARVRVVAALAELERKSEHQNRRSS